MTKEFVQMLKLADSLGVDVKDELPEAVAQMETVKELEDEELPILFQVKRQTTVLMHVLQALKDLQREIANTNLVLETPHYPTPPSSDALRAAYLFKELSEAKVKACGGQGAAIQGIIDLRELDCKVPEVMQLC